MNIRELAGREIDEYRLVAIIGQGGMSAVYRGYQEELDRDVAVKILSGDLANQPDYLQRFSAEAKMAAALEHPHIVPVYDFGVQSDLTYVVMRLLQTTLGQRNASDDNRLDIKEFISMAEAIAKALDYAHSRGIIHRDVKPSNIMFDAQNTPYLVDFGIAKAVQSDLNLTAENIVLGTPSYMSPEQWRDDNVSPKADQYSLAVVFFQTLTGSLPFTGSTSSQVMYKHLNEAPPNATEYNTHLPHALNMVLQRAMSKEARNRYPKVSDFVRALKEAVTTQSFSSAATIMRQPAVDIPSEPEPDAEATLEHPAIEIEDTYQSPAIDSEDTMPNPVINSEDTMPNPATSTTDETYKNMPAVAPPQQATAAPVPQSRTMPPTKNDEEMGQRTIMMQVARGGILGIAALLIIVIIILAVAIILFAPDAAEPETSIAPTSNAEVVDNPTDEPAVEITSRGDATPTVIIGGPIITPDVGIVGMDASQVEQVAMLLPVDPVPVRDAAYSPDAVMVAAGDGNGDVKLWRDGVNGSMTTLSGHSDVVSAIVFNPDGTLLASAGRDRTIRLWDTSSGNTVSVLSGHTGAIRDIAFSPDGSLLASGAEDGTLRLWNISTGQQVRSINADSTRVLSVAFSPEGQTVASGGRSGLVRLWNPATGAEYSNLTGHAEEVRSVAFSPDGQFVASSSTDNSAIIWRRDNGQRVHTIRVANDIFAVTFSPDSTLLATGGRDNNLRLWDVASAQELKTLTGHQGWVLGVAFAPDGASLITGSGDGSVRIWSAN